MISNICIQPRRHVAITKHQFKGVNTYVLTTVSVFSNRMASYETWYRNSLPIMVLDRDKTATASSRACKGVNREDLSCIDPTEIHLRNQ